MTPPYGKIKAAQPWSLTFILLALIASPASSTHHMQLAPRHLVNRQNSDLPLVVTNNCGDTIYPAILTQSGTGPNKSGFRLDPNASVSQNVSADWIGRVWGRTNCTFTDDGLVPQSSQGGSPCSSGDCGPYVECQGAGNPPATLTEFTMSSSDNQAFYDISLVDGYNLPVGVIFLPGNNSKLQDIPPNLTNPVCIGTASYLQPASSASDQTFGSNTTYPIPLEQSITADAVLKWCPWPLQLNPPQRPGDGVYPYPDNNIARPVFDPCLSACAKWNKDEYCCSGSYASPKKCKPSYYSMQAKKVCPDTYSYAFDDQTSTFVLPEGGGFEVVFCPTGRSSNILAVFGSQIREVARIGVSTPQINALARNRTYIAEKNVGIMLKLPSNFLVLVLLLIWAQCW